MTSDLFQVQAVVASAPFWVGNATLAAAVAVILVVTSPLLGVVAVAALPLVAFASNRFSKRVREAISDLQRERGALAGVVEETISGIRAVKGFGTEPVMEARLGASADAVLGEAMRVVRTRAHYLPTLNTVPMLELAAVNWLGGYLVLHHELSVGMLVAFNAYLAILTGPLQSIGAYIVMLQRAVVSCYRLSSIMDRRTSVPEPAIAQPLPPGPGAVRLDGVKFSYPGVVDGGAVLDGFELSIDGGEVVAMVGATGSGKTTVLSLLARLYDPTEGVVYLDGVDVASLGLATVRRAVAVVFEDSFLFNDTIEANLRVGRPDATDQELAEAAHLAQADEFIDELPHGYRTPVGERGLALSGGQRQRLALARALLADPRVLVLDDATSAVDSPRELQVVKALAQARQGKTTLIISHRPATIAVADRVVLIDDGQVVAQGTHEQLRATTPRYRHVLGIEKVPDDEQTRRTTNRARRTTNRARRAKYKAYEHEIEPPPTPAARSVCRPGPADDADDAGHPSRKLPRLCRVVASALPEAHRRRPRRAASRFGHHIGRPGPGGLDDQRRPGAPPFDARYYYRRCRLCRGERCIFRLDPCADSHGLGHRGDIPQRPQKTRLQPLAGSTSGFF